MGGECVYGRPTGDGFYEVRFLLSPPIRVRVIRPEDKLPLARARMQLREAFGGTLNYWSGCSAVTMPPSALSELEAYTPADRFFHLAQDEGTSEPSNLLGMTSATVGASGHVGITRFPAFRVDEVGDDLTLQFGHLQRSAEAPSGWRIYRHEGPIEVNGATYFRG